MEESYLFELGQYSQHNLLWAGIVGTLDGYPWVAVYELGVVDKH